MIAATIAPQTTTAPAPPPAPAATSTPDQVDELAAARAESVKAAAAVERAAQQLADAQTTAERLQLEKGDDVLAGRLTLPEAGAALAAAMAVVDAAKRQLQAARRAQDEARTREMAALGASYRAQADTLQTVIERQRREAAELVATQTTRDGFAAWVCIWQDPPQLSGLSSQATYAESNARARK